MVVLNEDNETVASVEKLPAGNVTRAARAGNNTVSLQPGHYFSGGIVLSERELAFIAIHKESYPRVYRFVRRRVESAEVAEEARRRRFPGGVAEVG